ncbi:hypothetical protein TTHERM_00294560 (macronuclear) [Tetrahymena thermophila SB210]|uniref:Ubiquitin-like domain-containing protein n=1 Tax=Tetrahymena thermophila (strain SB210) TaxID=312017 RepID=I7M7E3_TETTS|nr:hypothetical protein TTHERM_00294560 [Tetrahymena thermophila SB210]EAR92843.4 hypothetical protein TTHERM_00294560 [Tetrahymena thermophila SB210]|eukprot:XP_001013088.4 hypothetical protein TTHERM_00294560 [Tetrahymena thermophila SB210]
MSIQPVESQINFQKEIDDQLHDDFRKNKIKLDVWVSLKVIKIRDLNKYETIEVQPTQTIQEIRGIIQRMILKALKNPTEDQKQIIQDSYILLRDRFIPSPFEKIGDLYCVINQFTEKYFFNSIIFKIFRFLETKRKNLFYYLQTPLTLKDDQQKDKLID